MTDLSADNVELVRLWLIDHADEDPDEPGVADPDDMRTRAAVIIWGQRAEVARLTSAAKAVHALIDAVAALDAIAALTNRSGMEFARNYPQLNKALDLAEKSVWPDILSDYADAALSKITAALETK